MQLHQHCNPHSGRHFEQQGAGTLWGHQRSATWTSSGPQNRQPAGHYAPVIELFRQETTRSAAQAKISQTHRLVEVLQSRRAYQAAMPVSCNTATAITRNPLFRNQTAC